MQLMMRCSVVWSESWRRHRQVQCSAGGYKQERESGSWIFICAVDDAALRLLVGVLEAAQASAMQYRRVQAREGVKVVDLLLHS